MPKKAIKLPVEKVCVVSTGHITEIDTDLFARHGIGVTMYGLPRIEIHKHGWFICLSSDKASIRSHKAALRKAGFSTSFLRPFDMACKQDFSFINLDSAGEVIRGLTWHEW